jgi:predicted transposase YbfD/YdcC
MPKSEISFLGRGDRLTPVAVDGKAARSAPADTFSGCLHLVTPWATENGVMLGQRSVDDGSHEIAAVPELLKMLDLRGALVTLEAAGCQAGNAALIREGGGHDLLVVKGHQPDLHRAVVAAFDRALDAEFAGGRYDQHAAEADGHGRHEERYVTVLYDPPGRPPGWTGGECQRPSRIHEIWRRGGRRSRSSSRFFWGRVNRDMRWIMAT